MDSLSDALLSRYVFTPALSSSSLSKFCHEKDHVHAYISLICSSTFHPSPSAVRALFFCCCPLLPDVVVCFALLSCCVTARISTLYTSYILTHPSVPRTSSRPVLLSVLLPSTHVLDIPSRPRCILHIHPSVRPRHPSITAFLPHHASPSSIKRSRLWAGISVYLCLFLLLLLPLSYHIVTILIPFNYVPPYSAAPYKFSGVVSIRTCVLSSRTGAV